MSKSLRRKAIKWRKWYCRRYWNRCAEMGLTVSGLTKASLRLPKPPKGWHQCLYLDAYQYIDPNFTKEQLELSILEANQQIDLINQRIKNAQETFYDSIWVPLDD